MSHTLEASARSATLKTAVSATIPGGLNYDIAKGSAVANPVCRFRSGTTDRLVVLLDPTNPIEILSPGVGRLQRPGQTSWVDYLQAAVGAGDVDGFQILDRDEAVVFSGTVGVTGSGADYESANGVAWAAGEDVKTTGYVITQPATAV